MKLLDRYRSYLEGAYDRYGYGAIRVVSLWWMLCLLPPFFVDAHSALGLIVFWLFCGIMLAGVAGSGWHLWGIAIRRSNAKAKQLEDEEWDRFNR